MTIPKNLLQVLSIFNAMQLQSGKLMSSFSDVSLKDACLAFR